MSPFCRAYYSFRDVVRPLLAASKPQRENLCLLAFGLCSVGNAQLTRIAARLPLSIGVASAVQRLERLMKNDRVDPVRVYAPVARLLLSCFAGGRVRLIIDCTEVNGEVYLLFVAAAYRGRALPLAWITGDEYVSVRAFGAKKQLLDRVAALVPSTTQVVLLGDREFGAVDIIRYCHERDWRFCLRCKAKRRMIDLNGQSQLIGTMAREAGLCLGGQAFFSGLVMPKLPDNRVNLACGWSVHDKDEDPWFILTDLPADAHVLALYRVRFHIEEMFRDFKECGFRLEETRIHLRERVGRLILGICLAYVWTLNTGVWLSKRGNRKQVDRRPKRQLSYFRIGARYIEQALALAKHIPHRMAVYL